jgi:acyl-CoA thioester hydrolase
VEKRIYYHDTDCGGVVYYANYLKYLEEARTELFEEAGFTIKGLAEKGVLFVVARQEIDYKLPAAYGDILQVDTWVSGNSGVRLNFEAKIINQKGQLIAKAKTVLVCVAGDFKPQAIPDEICEKLAKLKAGRK